MRRSWFHRPSLLALTGAALATAVASPAVEVRAQEPERPPERLFRLPGALAGGLAGAVFTMTNSADPAMGNEVVAFNRLDDGSLVVAGYYPTGGLGGGPAPTSVVFGARVPANADALGSQNSLLLSDDGSQLFAVNAGSDSITCFPVQTNESGTTLGSPTTVPSGGVFPASLTFRRTGANRGVLYVLNAGRAGNITGFQVPANCALSRLQGGQRSLAGLISDPPFGRPPPNEVLTTADMIAFTPDGSQLVVAIKGGPEADGEGGFEGGVAVFGVAPLGRLVGQPPTVTEFSTDADTAGPFSFVFDENGNMVLNHANSFTVASYTIDDSGALTPNGAPVPISGVGGDSPLAFGGFNCWIVRRGDLIYVMTFGDIPATSGGLPDGPGVISALQIADDGSLTLLEETAAVLPQADRDALGPDGPVPGQVFGNHGIDMAVVEDDDGDFLYALQPRVGQVRVWEINDDGTLDLVGDFGGGLTPGVDPFAGTNPGINAFLRRCFLQGDTLSPECTQGSIQGIAGF